MGNLYEFYLLKVSEALLLCILLRQKMLIYKLF